MPAYKDKNTGKWYVSFYYEDWDGQTQKKFKRGFETKKEALDYEKNFSVKMEGSLNMVFEDFYELYKDNFNNLTINFRVINKIIIKTIENILVKHYLDNI